MPRRGRSVCERSPSGKVASVARIELWNGDICDLEVDAIVNAANLSLWMSTGVGGALKRAGGDTIEFAAVRQAPVPLGGAIVTPAGNLAAKAVIHAVSLDRDRRTSGPVIEAAVRSALARPAATSRSQARSGMRPGPTGGAGSVGIRGAGWGQGVRGGRHHVLPGARRGRVGGGQVRGVRIDEKPGRKRPSPVATRYEL